EIDGIRLRGRIADVHAHGIAVLRPGKPGGPSMIRSGLDRLLANAAGAALPLVQFHEADGLGPHAARALSAEAARDALRTLLQLRRAGLRAPLLYGPRTGWAIWNASNDDRMRRAAFDAWHGNDHAWGEATSDSMRLALRGRDPFANASDYETLVDTCQRVFAAVCAGMASGDDAQGEAA